MESTSPFVNKANSQAHDFSTFCIICMVAMLAPFVSVKLYIYSAV